MIETCARLHVPCLTLYAFSLENWRRPQAEVDFLMRLLREYLKRELPAIHKNNIRLRLHRALRRSCPKACARTSTEAMRFTGGNTGMKLVVALNYGGRAELADAFNALLDHEARATAAAFRADEEDISEHLYTAGLPDPDLLIRTSGEMRVSNFLLWQIAYAEIYVTEALWPDFSRARLLEALIEYQKRERRYGGLGAPRAAQDLPARRCERRQRKPRRGHEPPGAGLTLDAGSHSDRARIDPCRRDSGVVGAARDLAVAAAAGGDPGAHRILRSGRAHRPARLPQVDDRLHGRRFFTRSIRWG